jgi:signal transduction histidine kinase
LILLDLSQFLHARLRFVNPFRGRVSGVTALVAVVLLLVPALAWLQYRWVGQVSEAERERMQRTLRTSAAQFATAFDGELSRAVFGLQLEGSTLRDEDWTAYAQRYTTWVERGADERLLRDVVLVDVLPGHPLPPTSPDDLRLRRWNGDLRTFDAADWTPDLLAIRPVFLEHFGEIKMPPRAQGNLRFRREGAMSFSVGDDYTLVSPVTVFNFPEDHKTPPQIDVLGFTLIRLDPQYVRGTLLPTLTARHFHGDDGTADYRVAVTDRHEPANMIWESEAGAAEAIGRKADVDATFMSPRPDQVFMIARNGGGPGRGTPPEPLTRPLPEERIVVSVLQDRRERGDGPPTTRTGFSAFEGRWRVAATHRAGSLEAAVAAVRKRNLMLSSSILLLLTTAIGLIVVSARRAQTLARQQMEFVAAVSHELRTPVSVIGTAASNLADGVVADPARVRKYGETIQGESRRLAETVERVLQLAGIAAGSAAASRAPVPVADLVQQSLAACRPEIESKGVTVETDFPAPAPAVHGDAAALRSALQNLISNAVKYGGDARWVRITAQPSAPTRGRSGSSYVSISVADKGLGIAAEDRKHIFEPFYRGREAVSRQIQGSGLGLNLVARIAEAHGGRVEVTSEPGKGSVFTLVLPAATMQPAGDGVAYGLLEGRAS